MRKTVITIKFEKGCDLLNFIIEGVIEECNLSALFCLMSSLKKDYLTFRSKFMSIKNVFYYFNEVFLLPGPTHVDELFLFFPMPLRKAERQENKTADDIRISKELIKMWANFASQK
jgi:hypothetical protein